MRAGWAALLLLAGCTATISGDPVLVAIFGAPPPPVLNSPVFAKLPPPPGSPGYLDTIRFIDTGMRYIDPPSQFFVSPDGEICFRVMANYPQVIYEANYKTWCTYPQYVDRVEAATNDTTNINEVRLWCRRGYPQCVHSLEVGLAANYVSASTLDYRRERAALENLIYMMGGNVRRSEPALSSDSGTPGAY